MAGRDFIGFHKPGPTMNARALLAFVVIASSGPTVAGPVSETFTAGQAISGSFAYDVSSASADQSQGADQGTYSFAGSASFMQVVIGANVFSSLLLPGATLVVVNDGSAQGNDDFIQVSASGGSSTFGTYLDGFARQNPLLAPSGRLGLTFHFLNTYLASDALPLSIDPLQTVGPQPGSTFEPMFGGLEGVSMQTANSGTREWAIFYRVDNANVSFSNGIVTGTFTGTITGIDDRSQLGDATVVVSPVPEPETYAMFAAGVLLVSLLMRGQRRRESHAA